MHFKKTYPSFMQSVTSTYLTPLKPTIYGDLVLHLCDHLFAFIVMAGTALFLITPKGSFLFRKQKFTAKHTASIHKIIYGADN